MKSSYTACPSTIKKLWGANLGAFPWAYRAVQYQSGKRKVWIFQNGIARLASPTGSGRKSRSKMPKSRFSAFLSNPNWCHPAKVTSLLKARKKFRWTKLMVTSLFKAKTQFGWWHQFLKQKLHFSWWHQFLKQKLNFSWWHHFWKQKLFFSWWHQFSKQKLISVGDITF